MLEFVKLSSEQALELYKIPRELVEVTTNSFYSSSNTPNTPYDDGPWPLLSFLTDKEHKDRLIIQLSTIHLEALRLEEFDPFDDGYVNLNKSYLMSFSKLLAEQARKIANNDKGKFILIDPSKYDDYHLLPPNHPKSFQLHWRLHNIDDDSNIRLITISCGRVYGRADPNDNLDFLISFSEFSKYQLYSVKFTPLDDAPSRLALNYSELLDLISAFEYAIEFYENNLPTMIL